MFAHGTPTRCRRVAWFTTTAILPALAFGWLGWRMPGQDRAIQRARWLTNLVEWTPDRRRVVFSKNDGTGNGSRFWVIPVSGDKPIRLQLDVRNSNAIRIHPDGRQVAFNTGTRAWEVWRLENFLPATTTAAKK